MKKLISNLRLALQGNATFSALSGLTLLFLPGSVAQFMGLKDLPILTIMGIGLLLFATVLLRITHSQKLPIQLIRVVIYLDWAWVLASLFTILWQPGNLMIGAYLLIGGIAIIVAGFALWQMYGLQNIT